MECFWCTVMKNTYANCTSLDQRQYMRKRSVSRNGVMEWWIAETPLILWNSNKMLTFLRMLFHRRIFAKEHELDNSLRETLDYKFIYAYVFLGDVTKIKPVGFVNCGPKTISEFQISDPGDTRPDVLVCILCNLWTLCYCIASVVFVRICLEHFFQ